MHEAKAKQKTTFRNQRERYSQINQIGYFSGRTVISKEDLDAVRRRMAQYIKDKRS